MKTLISALMACCAGVVLAFAPPAGARTVGSGNVITEARTVGEFESISTNGSIDVLVRQAAKEAVEVQAEDNLVPLIETVVEGKKLVIRFRKGESISTRKPVLVKVDVVRLTGVASAGSGDVTVQGLKSPVFKLSLSGSSDAKLQSIAIDSFEIAVAGSSDVRADGSTKTLVLRIAGSGDAHLGSLAADDVQIKIAGSGDATVRAEKSLDVSIAGSGDVTWSGAATQVKSSTAGSGSITKR